MSDDKDRNKFFGTLKMKVSALITKLEGIVRAGKPKSIKVNSKNYYISKKKIEECQNEGGLLPLVTLIPLIAGGIGAAGAVTGGAAEIAKAVHDEQAQDAELSEEKRHNREIKKAVGRSIKEHVKNFLQATDLENYASKSGASKGSHFEQTSGIIIFSIPLCISTYLSEVKIYHTFSFTIVFIGFHIYASPCIKATEKY